jgi:hypothetical protein
MRTIRSCTRRTRRLRAEHACRGGAVGRVSAGALQAAMTGFGKVSQLTLFKVIDV